MKNSRFIETQIMQILNGPTMVSEFVLKVDPDILTSFDRHTKTGHRLAHGKVSTTVYNVTYSNA